MSDHALKETPLYALHGERGARMVPFADYLMPVQYPTGILQEHAHTRNAAGLFDVSHMGQAFLDIAPGAAGDIAAILESLVPGDLQSLAPGRMRYTMLLNGAGGIIDDLMVTRVALELGGNRLYLVVNAGCKDGDFAHIAEALAGKARLTRLAGRALLALQGPQAAAVMARIAPAAAGLDFMAAGVFALDGVTAFISRSGYTGEDGFEISLPASAAEAFARRLLAEPEVALIGLGARDSLRLEAGLCLYGHDIDATTSPVEAGLTWAVAKRRRAEANFPGAARILQELTRGPSRKRVGLRPEGRVPAREGAEIVDSGGRVVGRVTSGGFGATVNGPITMGYVEPSCSEIGTPLGLKVREKTLPATVVALPFVAHHYRKKPA